jgi:hypothetical protein
MPVSAIGARLAGFGGFWRALSISLGEMDSG